LNTSTTNSAAQITLRPSGKRYEAIPGRSLLESGLSAGLALPFGCANGSCGNCLAKVIEGDTVKINHHDFTLTEAEKLQGNCLLCATAATSDCIIEVSEAGSSAEMPFQQLQAKLCRHENLEGVDIVAFKFSRGKALRFLPGQRVTLSTGDGTNIELPIASCPCNAHQIEFHLAPGIGSTKQRENFIRRCEQLSGRDRIDVSGPSGSFTLSQESSRPKLFVARGIEFGQLQGLIEQVFNLDTGTPICLIWQSSDSTDQYLNNLCRSWHDAFDEFDYLPVATDADFLQDLPLSWKERLNAVEVYLGTQDKNRVAELLGTGVSGERIYYPDSAPG